MNMKTITQRKEKLNMHSRIIFLDIDGTLTEPGSNIPPESALTAIRKAQERGHYVFLCTGRNYGMLSPLLKYDFDGVIASSGGYIKCKKKVIFNCPMTVEQRIKAMNVFKNNGIFRTIECMNDSYTDEEFKEFLRKNTNKGNNSELLRWREQIESSLNILPMKEYDDQPIYKMVFMTDSEKRLEEPKKILGDEFLFCIQSKDKYGFINGELINYKFNKGQAIERVCEYLQIPVEHSIAFGDSMNDLEMMETAGLSICMKNGCEQLKKISDDVCLSVTDDGLYHAFIKYHLI